MLENLMLFLLFLVFLVLARKAVSIFFNAVLIALLGAAFPFVVDFLGIYQVELTLNNVAFFALCAVLLYLAYIYLRALFRLSRSISSILVRKRRKEEASSP